MTFWNWLFKSPQQIGIFGEEQPTTTAEKPKTKMRGVRIGTPKEEHVIGDVKEENGKRYILLETTIEKPRWHTYEEASELAAQGKLKPTSLQAFQAKQRPTLRQMIGGKKKEPEQDYSKLTSKEAVAKAKELGKKSYDAGIEKPIDDKELLKLRDSKKTISDDIRQAWDAGWMERRNEKISSGKESEKPETKEAPLKQLMDTQREILQLAKIPEKDIPKYAQSSYADGEKLHTYADKVIAGEMTKEQAAKKVKTDYEKLKPGEEEKDDLTAAVNKKVAKEKKKTAPEPNPYQELDLFSAAAEEPKPEAEKEKQLEKLLTPEEKEKIDQLHAEQQKKEDNEFGVSANIVNLQKKREEWNRQAIEILKKPDSEITDEDKKILAKYSGDGGTTENSLNEFYTSKEVASFQWKMMKKFGFNGGNVLEPSVGTGVYVHTKPEDTLVTGIEISDVSARIARILHPHDDIRNMPFEQLVVDGGEEPFDGFIGNIPFGTRGASKAIDEPKISTHEEYFLSKIFDLMRGGAVGSFIVPTGVMDNEGNKRLRQLITERAQFLGAYRLPNTAFKHSGTSVTTDIIFFRKHPDKVVDQLSVLKSSPEGMKVVDDSGIYDRSFIDGQYFDANEGHLLGTKDIGNWGRTIVKGRLTDEQFEKILSESPIAPMDYSKITTEAEVYERKLEVGDTMSRNGHLFRLNENHRWERADLVDEEKRQKRIQNAYHEFGISNPEEFHQALVDISSRSKFTRRQRDTVEDYLSAVDHNELPERDTIVGLFRNALRFSRDGETEAEQNKIYVASILGDEIDRLKKYLDQGNEPDYRKFEQLILLLNEYKEKNGNPYTDKLLIKNAGENRSLSYFTGAFKDNGELSDFLLSPEKFVQHPTEAPREFDPASLPSILRYFDNNKIEGTIDKIARFYSGAKGKSDEELEAVLLADPAIGFDKGQYLPIDKLTTGSVYDKLDRWTEEIAAIEKGDDPHKELKSNKLRSQQDQLRAKANFRKIAEMPIEFSSRWIALDYLNEFLHSHGWKQLLWDADRNQYDVDDTTSGETPSRFNMYGDFINYINGEGLKHGSENQKRLANLMELQERYKQFLSLHKDSAIIEDAFNRKFNNYVNEAFDDTPFKIDKMKEGFDLNRYHYSALRRLLSKKRGILAYGTGLGKTFAGIALAFLQKQLGQAKKPMIVVPKSVLSNWDSEISKFVGDKEAKVMLIGAHQRKDKKGNIVRGEDGKPVMDDDTFEDVQHKFQLVSQNDYDIVLCTYEKMKSLTLSDETTEKYFEDILDRHIRRSNEDKEKKEEAEAAIESAVGRKSKKTKHGEMEAKESLLGELAVRQTRGAQLAEHINFEQLGIDSLIVDEAHNFKNLFGLIGRQGQLVGGMAQPDTQRSMRMYMLSRWIREKNNGNNVTLMTATPTVNNPLEVFNMLQFIAPEEMDKRNIFNMGEFFGVFGDVQKQPYLRANNELVDRDTLTGFKTLPELRQLMHEYTDMRTAEDVGLKIPKANEQNVLSPKTELQTKVYEALRMEANNYLQMTPQERIDAGYHEGDYMKILSDMQKATISLKLLAKTGSEFSHKELLPPSVLEEQGITPKMQQCIENTLTTFKAGDKKLIFVEYKDAQEELKNHLIKAGIPKDQIAIVNADTASSSAKRQKFSEDYNSGKFKVIIGNRTMSEGMNFQVETAEIDHLDLPYTPSALIQRNGRGVRQGNKKGSVRLNYYLTNGTYDAALNAIIQRKKNWQWDLWKGDADKAANEGGGMNLTPEEQAILMSDDPDAARLIVEQNKKTAVKKQQEQKQSRALSTFNQMQNLMAQYKRLDPAGRQTPEGKQISERIAMAKDLLLKDTNFENKDVLENNEPAYIDSDKNILIPSGHYFTDTSGDWKKAGLYKFTSVDPINRKVVIQKLASGTEGKKTEYGSSIPDDPGELQTVDYKNLREFFKDGMKPVNVQHSEFQNHIIDNLSSFRQLSIIDTETLSNRKSEIVDRLLKGSDDSARIPVIDKKSGEVQIVEARKLRVNPEHLKYAEESDDEASYWKKEVEREKKELLNPETIYLPIDDVRWRNDILNRALDEQEKYLEWHRRYKGTSRRSWRPPMPDTPFKHFAEELYGYYWFKTLPNDFVRKGKAVKVEEGQEEEGGEEEV